MKKIYKVLLAFLMVVSFSACSGDSESKPLTIEVGKENKFDGLVTYQIETIGKTQQITPDVIGTVYTYYKPTKSTNVLADIVMKVTNLKDEEMKLSSVLKGTYVIDEVDYEASTVKISEDGKTISQNATLEAKESARIHFYAEVSPDKLGKDIEFKFTNKDEDKPVVASMNFTLKDANKHYESKNLNDTIASNGKGDIVLQSVNVTKQIEPSSPTGLYTYYKVKSDTDSFVVLTTSITNTSGSDLAASSVAFAKLVDSNGVEYPASVLYEKDDHSNLASGSSTTFTSNQSGTVHFAFEVKDEVANGEKTVIITTPGKVFTLKA